ncbi:carbamoyltransferase C-terminal domain-containing protein [Kitasatospora sp. CB02891]|uniref:carbamoyltransferase family protein n=1 Tax=Kitasatospora sp. CB02891 TaxID=2020329 RepID=UPI000C27DFC4|nr:carbamoyltransferase C-terminal domain-containing protein [Kitasatospora sp. CB02891]PJN22593.1 carbamoyltransferase [Kitasatospora sp. CB02891]
MIVIGYNGFTDGAETFGRLYGATGIDRHSILGHDAAAALFVDGELVAAVEEERLNREKKTSDFPVNSVRWCLETAGKSLEDVDFFAFPWAFSPELTADMIGDISGAGLTVEQKFDRLRRFGDLYTGLVSKEAILADLRRRTGLDIPADKLVLVPHHLAHLMCGHYLAGGEDTAFLISDGRAERLSSIMGEVRDGRIQVFENTVVGVTHSLALLFGEITRYLGFMPNNDEYKVMGLAGFTGPRSDNPLLKHVVELQENGRYALALANEPSGTRAYYGLLDELYGVREGEREELDFRIRLARDAQEMIEVVTAHQLGALQARTDLPRLVFEGGLALNCVNNTKLLEESGFTDIQVSFGASDPGVAIGAAAFVNGVQRRPRRTPATPYLGPSYDDDAITAALREQAEHVEWTELDPADLARETAKLLSEKTVIGWFQGRTEYGPRALGNRSILANPGFPDIKDIINTRVKHREPFRPFAPVVLEHEAPKVFEMGKKSSSPYMTFVFPVKPEHQEAIPGACHVDGTSRVQTITDESNPLLAELLRTFTELTGVPCLLNTSFNVAGEPIVNSPADAIQCFLGTEIDHLVLGRFLVGKRAPQR